MTLEVGERWTSGLLERKERRKDAGASAEGVTDRHWTPAELGAPRKIWIWGRWVRVESGRSLCTLYRAEDAQTPSLPPTHKPTGVGGPPVGGVAERGCVPGAPAQLRMWWCLSKHVSHVGHSSFVPSRFLLSLLIKGGAFFSGEDQPKSGILVFRLEK